MYPLVSVIVVAQAAVVKSAGHYNVLALGYKWDVKSDLLSKNCVCDSPLKPQLPSPFLLWKVFLATSSAQVG